jgi:integrase
MPRFGDDVWNIGVAGFAGNRYASEFLIDFKSLGHPVRREAAREFLFWRLNTRPGRGPLPSISTVAAEWWNLRCFFRFLDTEHEGLRLDAVTQPVLDAYLAHCRGEGLLATSVRHRLQVISRLHLAAQAVVTDALAINPWNGRSPTRVIGVEPTRKHENETPRIPPNVIGPLVQAALFYIRTAAKDIISARAELTELEASVEDIHGLSLNRLEHYLHGLADEGRGVPVVDEVGRQVHLAGAPAYTYVMRKSGAGRGVAGGVYDERIDRALELLGPEPGGMDTPIAPHPRTGLPWRDRFSPAAVHHEERLLRTACYILIAYLSGMRDSEVKELRDGCHFTERSADGVVVRHKVRSQLIKGGRGTAESWVVIGPVAEAIDALQQLPHCDALFCRPVTRDRYSTVSANRMNENLNKFRAHCTRIGFPVPDVDGEPWNLTTRQFRRTVAWHIAHRPYGTVAGMIQYKHLSVAMFEGYAGTSASGFRAEVAAEEAMARLADVVERYEDFKAGVRSSAPGSTRTDNEFARVQEELQDFPGRVVDERRLHAMLRTSANTLHVGTLNDCYYQPETALCRTAGSTDQPMLNNCRPDRCGNSTITTRHRNGWEAARGDTERALAFVGLSDLQRTALREHLNDVSKVIEGIDRAND